MGFSYKKTQSPLRRATSLSIPALGGLYDRLRPRPLNQWHSIRVLCKNDVPTPQFLSQNTNNAREARL